MKITKDRIIAAYQRNQQIYQQKVSRPLEVMSAFASIGFKSWINEQTGADLDLTLDAQKASLTVNYYEYKIEDLPGLGKLVQHLCEHANQRTQKIYKIQSHHGFSGLIEDSLSFKNSIFNLFKEHETLRLIESDLKKLRFQKKSIIRFAKTMIGFHSLKVWYWSEIKEDFVLSSVEALESFSDSDHYDWIDIYSFDNKEINLRLGSGLNIENPEPSAEWFILSVGRPDY